MAPLLWGEWQLLAPKASSVNRDPWGSTVVTPQGLYFSLPVAMSVQSHGALTVTEMVLGGFISVPNVKFFS